MRRIAEGKDLLEVYAIYMDDSVIPYLGYDPMPLEEFKPIYAELINSNNFYLFEKNHEIAGFYYESRYAGRTRHVAHLGTLAVSPKYQGQGIAKEMLKEAIEKMKDSGIKRVELIVESDNLRAISFYEKFGFEIEGKLRKYYKRSHENHYTDDYMMSLLF